MSPGFSVYGPLLIQRIRAIGAKPDAHRSRWSHSRDATACSRTRSTVTTLRRRLRGRAATRSSQKWHFDAQGRHQRDAVEQGLKHLLPTQKWSRRGHLRRRERLEELGPEFVTAPPKPLCRATASSTSRRASSAGVTPATTKARRDVALVCSCDLRGPRLQREDVGDAWNYRPGLKGRCHRYRSRASARGRAPSARPRIGSRLVGARRRRATRSC